MGKIDIVSLTGLTGIDGSVVASGATIKFETVFHVGTTDIEIRLRVYRNRELFESGYYYLKVVELPDEFIIKVSEEEFYVITPQILYQKVCEHLNNHLGGDCFELKIIE